MFNIRLTIAQSLLQISEKANIFKRYRTNQIFEIFHDLTRKSEVSYIYPNVQYANCNTLEKVRLLLISA